MSGFHKHRIGAAVLAAASALFSITAPASASVEISTNPTANMTCSGGVCSPTAKKAFLNVTDLAGMLSSGDVKVTSGSIALDIDIKATLSWVSTSRLTLDSYRSIAFDKPVEIAGTGALIITTNDGGTGGDFVFSGNGHVKFWDTSSSLVINGTSYALIDSIHMLYHRTKKHGGFFALAKSIDASRVVYNGAPIPNFGGIFEGLGNTISHLTINDSTEERYVGFFGTLYQSSIIRDIGLISVDVQDISGIAQYAGALVGDINPETTIANSYATGQVAIADGGAGGLVGQNSFGTIIRSHAAVAVSVTGTFGAAGGLIGENDGSCVLPCVLTVSESYSTGTVSAGDGLPVGGLAGRNIGGTISNSYATGAIAGGNDAPVGGLVGSNEDAPTEDAVPVITYSYSTGAVSGGSGAVLGGLIGQDATDSSIADAYWDLGTSGISDPTKGAGNISNDPGITGLTTAQFQSGLPVGFDKEIWRESPGINNGYPYLLASPQQ